MDGPGSLPLTDPVNYDPPTHSVHVTIRPGAPTRQRMDEGREAIIDLGQDGEVVGYDIQFASKRPDIVAEALSLLYP